jgi:predicted acyltransferase
MPKPTCLEGADAGGAGGASGRALPRVIRVSAPIKPSAAGASAPDTRGPRIVSIDALRGLVVFTMIFVNDIAGVSPAIVPPWLRHFPGPNGMTLVDLVFPAFLFVVGMSIPLALGARLDRGAPLWQTLGHVLVRTVSLLAIGVLMVQGTPSTERMGWSGTWWSVLMYLSAFLAFSNLSVRHGSTASERATSARHLVSLGLRVVGLAGLVGLALVYRGKDGQCIISFAPFSIRHSWYGILGLIGWAYLVGAVVFLAFRGRRTALLGCVVLLLGLYPAAKTGAFEGFWLARHVSIGDTLGALPSITVAGLLLASTLVTPDTATPGARVRFTLLFIAGCAAGALLLHGLYGIHKNSATPSWCLWACAISAAVWLLFHGISEVRPLSFLIWPFALAGQNVLLAFLLSEMLYSVRELLGIAGWYAGLAEASLASAIARPAACAVAVLAVTAGLNRAGFRLRL